jgi:hypothetical protein
MNILIAPEYNRAYNLPILPDLIQPNWGQIARPDYYASAMQ